MMDEKTELKEIFAMLRQGDKRGVELLYSFHYDKMFGAAFSVLKNREKSEDVVQNVVLKLLALDSDKFPTEAESTWLYKVVKNEAIDFVKKDKPCAPIENALDSLMTENSIDNYVDMDAFNSLVSKLDRQREEIVTLKILGGYTHKEIASMLNMKIGTVQWLYATAITKLKVILSSLMALILTLLPLGIIELLIFESPKKSRGGSSSTIWYNWTDGKIAMVVVSFAVGLIAAGLFVFFLTKNHKTPTKFKSKTSK